MQASAFVNGVRQRLAALRNPRVPWVGEQDGLKVRGFRSYEDYVAVQASKARRIGNLDQMDRRFEEALESRLADLELAGARVLCLAARAGGEVRAFAARGAFAIGIDLAPTPSNRYVVYGDFHQLQWHDETVDVVYCNSLDHAYDLPKLLAEVRRVLATGGTFIAEIARGSAEGLEAGPWEALWWDRAGDLVALIEKHGFRVGETREFDNPWSGLHVRFARSGNGTG